MSYLLAGQCWNDCYSFRDQKHWLVYVNINNYVDMNNYVDINNYVDMTGYINLRILIQPSVFSTPWVETDQPYLEPKLLEWTGEDWCPGRRRWPAPTMSATRSCRTGSRTTCGSARGGLPRTILLARRKLPAPTLRAPPWWPRQNSASICTTTASTEDEAVLYIREKTL